jgi:AmiR/NasT family two-component response regulator
MTQMKWIIPNFRNTSALILHRQDSNFFALVNQLNRLEMQTTGQWPPIEKAEMPFDVVFFDVDQGFDGMFPWRKNRAPLPIIAMIGSETPGRLEWALDQNPAAFILKPIGSNGAFQALVTAHHAFTGSNRIRDTMEALEDRLRLRPLVLRVIMDLMKANNLSDEEAFAILRSASMRRQVTIEDLAQRLAQGQKLTAEDLTSPGSQKAAPTQSGVAQAK